MLQLFWLIGLDLLLLFAVLTVFLRGRTGLLVVNPVLTVLMLVKGLALGAIITNIAVLGFGVLLERPVQKWSAARRNSGSFSGLIGALVILLIYGAFLGPLGSVFLWLCTIGLQLLPQLKSLPKGIVDLGDTFFRLTLATSVLVLGIYAIYTG